MEQYLETLLKKLEEKNKSGKYWNVSRETGTYLFNLILKHKPKTIVEVGASNGYSTIFLALAAQKIGAKVISYEFVPEKVGEWVSNLQHARLIKYVQIIPDDANKRLTELTDKVDFLFLDARKCDYLKQLKLVEKKLSKKTIIAADNVMSHAPILTDYLKYVRTRYRSELINIGTGLEVSRK